MINSCNSCFWNEFLNIRHLSQKRLYITLISWVRYVVWFIKCGTRTGLNNFVNAATIGYTKSRQVWIFDFTNSTNLLYIQFLSFSHSNLSRPPMFKWIILSEKIGRSFKWFPSESNRVSRSNKFVKHSIISSFPLKFCNFEVLKL